MKAKKVIAMLLAATLSVTAFTGCAINKTATVATLDKEDIKLGLVNFMIRYQEAGYDDMYIQYMGEGYWDKTVSGNNTVLETWKKNAIEEAHELYTLKAHQSDYDVEVSDDEKKEIKKAAEKFMKANSDDVIDEMSATEEIVEEYLELRLIKSKMYAAIIKNADSSVTDEEAIGVALMVLAGKINKTLVNLIELKGGSAIGLSGLDGHMLEAKIKKPELGYVGEITNVNVKPILDVLDKGYIPVVSTVGYDDAGNIYNINADTAAAAIAIALHAEKFVSMTDIVGLLYDKDDESTLIPEVEISEIEGYKAHGVISGGMIPKIEGMADAIYEGVHEAVIIDGRVPHSVLLEMFSDRGSGTLFYRRGNR